jgi:F-box associated protein
MMEMGIKWNMGMGDLNIFPAELQMMILNKLNYVELCRTVSVSKQWKNLAQYILTKLDNQIDMVIPSLVMEPELIYYHLDDSPLLHQLLPYLEAEILIAIHHLTDSKLIRRELERDYRNETENLYRIADGLSLTSTAVMRFLLIDQLGPLGALNMDLREQYVQHLTQLLPKRDRYESASIYLNHKLRRKLMSEYQLSDRESPSKVINTMALLSTDNEYSYDVKAFLIHDYSHLMTQNGLIRAICIFKNFEQIHLRMGLSYFMKYAIRVSRRLSRIDSRSWKLKYLHINMLMILYSTFGETILKYRIDPNYENQLISDNGILLRSVDERYLTILPEDLYKASQIWNDMDNPIDPSHIHNFQIGILSLFKVTRLNIGYVVKFKDLFTNLYVTWDQNMTDIIQVLNEHNLNCLVNTSAYKMQPEILQRMLLIPLGRRIIESNLDGVKQCLENHILLLQFGIHKGIIVKSFEDMVMLKTLIYEYNLFDGNIRAIPNMIILHPHFGFSDDTMSNLAVRSSLKLEGYKRMLKAWISSESYQAQMMHCESYSHPSYISKESIPSILFDIIQWIDIDPRIDLSFLMPIIQDQPTKIFRPEFGNLRVPILKYLNLELIFHIVNSGFARPGEFKLQIMLRYLELTDCMLKHPFSNTMRKVFAMLCWIKCNQLLRDINGIVSKSVKTLVESIKNNTLSQSNKGLYNRYFDRYQLKVRKGRRLKL